MPFQGEARRQIKDRFHSPPFDSLLDDYTSRLRPHVEKEFHYGSGITADHLKQLMGKVKGNQSNVREGWISTRVEHPDVLSVTYDKETDSFSAGRANEWIIFYLTSYLPSLSKYESMSDSFQNTLVFNFIGKGTSFALVFNFNVISAISNLFDTSEESI